MLDAAFPANHLKSSCAGWIGRQRLRAHDEIAADHRRR
jgi:hypothetical protein